MSESFKKITESKAFKNLGKERLGLFKELENKKNVTAADIGVLADKLGRLPDISAEEKSALFSAFIEGLSEEEKKKISYIFEIADSLMS